MTLDESGHQAHDETMSDITQTDWDNVEQFLQQFTERVTVTTTHEIHACTEALIVSVRIWVDDETPERLDRVRWQAAQLRSAMEQGDQL